MAVPKVGINFSNLNNVSAPNISILDDPTNIIPNIPESANNLVGIAMLTHLVLGGLSFLLYWVLSDKTPLRDFGYSDLRAGVLALGLSTTIGVVMVQVDYLRSFKSLAFYGIFMVLLYILLIMQESKT